MAPMSSPISRAFDVPTTWLAVPIATPSATLFLTRKSFIMKGASILPATPVRRRDVTVSDLMPPRLSEIAMAIGVVTLFGSRDEISGSLIPNSFERNIIDIIDAMLPAIVPASIDSKWLFTSSLSL